MRQARSLAVVFALLRLRQRMFLRLGVCTQGGREEVVIGFMFSVKNDVNIIEINIVTNEVLLYV